MENSIEEDIKLVEELINAAKEYNQFGGNKYHKAIEHILKDYKRVLKENEELNNRCKNLDEEAQAYLEELAGDNTLTRRTIKQLQEENEELNYKLHSKKIALEIYNRYIPKSKVEEKIEELDKEEKRELKGTKGQDRYYIKQKYMYKRKVLEELLREE